MRTLSQQWYVLTLPWLFLLWLTIAQVLAALKLHVVSRYGICESNSIPLRWAAAAGYAFGLIIFGGIIVSTV